MNNQPTNPRETLTLPKMSNLKDILYYLTSENFMVKGASVSDDMENHLDLLLVFIEIREFDVAQVLHSFTLIRDFFEIVQTDKVFNLGIESISAKYILVLIKLLLKIKLFSENTLGLEKDSPEWNQIVMQAQMAIEQLVLFLDKYISTERDLDPEFVNFVEASFGSVIVYLDILNSADNATLQESEEFKNRNSAIGKTLVDIHSKLPGFKDPKETEESPRTEVTLEEETAKA